MTKRNYAAWHINPRAFSDSWSTTEKLLFFARYAVLAPSGHNTQPWKLTIQDDALLVAIHPDHHLSIDGSGLLSVEPYISLGAFLEIFELAAKGFGYHVTIITFPKKSVVAKIQLHSLTTALPELLDAITQRVSNRNPFQTTPLPKEDLEVITAGAFAKVKQTVVDSRKDIDFVAEQTILGITGIMSNPLYREELSHWVRTNHTWQYDGMPGFTHGFGTIPALVSKAAIKHAPAGGPQANKSGKLIHNSGALVIVRCTEDSNEAFINAGRAYAHICVLAQSRGYATSALGASVLDPVSREHVTKYFGIKDRPIYILRIGKTSLKARHSPRWPLEKLVSRVSD